MEIDILVLCGLIAVCGLTSAGVIIGLTKVGLIKWYELNRPTWMPLVCNFCISFWLSAVIVGLLFIFGFKFEWIYFLTPFASGAVSRLLI